MHNAIEQPINNCDKKKRFGILIRNLAMIKKTIVINKIGIFRSLMFLTSKFSIYFLFFKKYNNRIGIK